MRAGNRDIDEHCQAQLPWRFKSLFLYHRSTYPRIETKKRADTKITIKVEGWTTNNSPTIAEGVLRGKSRKLVLKAKIMALI